VTLDCGHGGAFARRVLEELLARDIFVRMPTVAPQDRCVRVGTGPPAVLDLLEQELPAALAAARAPLLPRPCMIESRCLGKCMHSDSIPPAECPRTARQEHAGPRASASKL
jgi:hypothetical protein